MLQFFNQSNEAFMGLHFSLRNYMRENQSTTTVSADSIIVKRFLAMILSKEFNDEENNGRSIIIKSTNSDEIWSWQKLQKAMKDQKPDTTICINFLHQDSSGTKIQIGIVNITNLEFRIFTDHFEKRAKAMREKFPHVKTFVKNRQKELTEQEVEKSELPSTSAFFSNITTPPTLNDMAADSSSSKQVLSQPPTPRKQASKRKKADKDPQSTKGTKRKRLLSSQVITLDESESMEIKTENIVSVLSAKGISKKEKKSILPSNTQEEIIQKIL